MTNDLISRQAALDAISCDITVTGRQNAELVAATIGSFADRIKALPSAQPKPTTEIQEILNYLDTTLHPIVSPDNWYAYAELFDMVSRLPSAQPDGIPLEWIDKHLEWLGNCENDFAQLAKVSIRAMVEIWKKDKT